MNISASISVTDEAAITWWSKIPEGKRDFVEWGLKLIRLWDSLKRANITQAWSEAGMFADQIIDRCRYMSEVFADELGSKSAALFAWLETEMPPIHKILGVAMDATIERDKMSRNIRGSI